MLAEELDKKRKNGHKENEVNSFNIEAGGGEKGDYKENEEVEFGRFGEVVDNKEEKPGKSAIKPGESFKRNKESLESVEIEKVVESA